MCICMDGILIYLIATKQQLQWQRKAFMSTDLQMIIYYFLAQLHKPLNGE